MAYRSYSYSETTTVTKPTGTIDGDILVAFAQSYVSGNASYDPDITFPAGWSVIDNFDYDGAATPYHRYRAKVGYKRASSEGASYNFTVSGTYDSFTAVMGCYSGRLATGDPVSDYDEGGNNTTNTVLNTESIDALAGDDVVWIGGIYGTTRTVDNVPSGMNSRVEDEQCALADLENVSAGATGDKDGTISSSTGSLKAAYLLGLKIAAVTVKPWYYYAQQ